MRKIPVRQVINILQSITGLSTIASNNANRRGGSEALGYGSTNNFFTAGNNVVRLTVRNMDNYPKLFTISLETNSSWKTVSTTFEIDSSELKNYNIL